MSGVDDVAALAGQVEAAWDDEAALALAPPASRAALVGELRLATAIAVLLADDQPAATAERVLALIAAGSPSRRLRTLAAVERRLPRPRARRWWLAAALVAAAAAAVVPLWSWTRAPLRLASGAASCGGRALAPGGALRVGDEATTVDGAVFGGADGSTVALGADAALRIEAIRRWRLQRGSLAGAIAHQPAPLRLVTADAEALVLGTRLELRVDAAGTRLAVSEGRVRLTRLADGAAAEVAGGEYAVAAAGVAPLARHADPASAYAAWDAGPSQDPAWFPLAVWRQDPGLAGAYRAAGISLYAGLDRPADASALAALRAAGMPLMADPSAALVGESGIVGWLADEAASHPALIDATRPWLRRAAVSAPAGAGADLAAFDPYPALRDGGADDVARLQRAMRERPTWAVIELTVGPPRAPPAYDAWLGLALGARGLLWDVRRPDGGPGDPALARDPALLAALGAVARRIAALAPVLNAPAELPLSARSDDPRAPVAALVHRAAGATWLIAVETQYRATRVAFALAGLPPRARAEALDEQRALEVVDGRFADDFARSAVHLYRIR